MEAMNAVATANANVVAATKLFDGPTVGVALGELSATAVSGTGEIKVLNHSNAAVEHEFSFDQTPALISGRATPLGDRYYVADIHGNISAFLIQPRVESSRVVYDPVI